MKWPGHKVKKLSGALLLGNGDMTFSDATDATGLENKNFGFGNIFADMNGDGYKDVLYVNLGSAARVLLHPGTQNNTVQFVFADNVRSLGARIDLTIGQTILSKRYNPKQGLMSDQSAILTISLGDQSQAEAAVTYRDGTVDTFAITKNQMTIELGQ